MNFTEDGCNFLTRLQQLEFCGRDDSIEPSALADSRRNLYFQLSQAVNEDERFEMEMRDSLASYADIVDKMDGSGLNNFAEEALALCNFHKNESTKWTSSLDADSILDMCSLDDAEPVRGSDQLCEETIIKLHGEKRRTATSSFSTDSVSIQNPALVTSAATVSPLQYAGRDYSPHSSNVVGLAEPPSHVTDSKGQSWVARADQSVMPGYQGQSNTVRPNNWSVRPTSGQRSQHQGSVPEPVRNASAALLTGADCLSAYSSGSQHQPQNSRLLVDSTTAGGPYSNFGQKRKNPGRNGNQGSRQSGKSWRLGREDVDDADDTDEDVSSRPTPFRTARQQLVINQQKNHRGAGVDRSQVSGTDYGAGKKSLGTRRGPAGKFVPPVLSKDSSDIESSHASKQRGAEIGEPDELMDERLRGIDPKMIELITNEIMDHGTRITWDDIAGLQFAKKTIKEIVVWPMLRPDIFTGLRGPPKGLLLFGPPGTGKTLIGKCIASQSKSTFFSISASSLTSKWVGEGEKMVRALFAVARVHQPAVVFIDEIDSLLSQRSDTEHESSRRIKTEFLVQLDGASTASDDRLLVIGATNRPQEIDEAARRRFVKRLLIPLPEALARRHIVASLMSQQDNQLQDEDIQMIVDKTDGYSGSDMTNLCREAALGPIRSIPFEEMESVAPDQVRPILVHDFENALLQVRASVSGTDLKLYTDWNRTYGSFG